MTTIETEDYWKLVPVSINGIDRVGLLYEQGRVEEARDLFISAARAVWTLRWSSMRDFSLKRLGESLDLERFPKLTEIARALRNGEAGAAGRLLDFLRARSSPDIEYFTVKPDADVKQQNRTTSLQLWQTYTVNGDPELKEQLDARIATFLDPVKVIGWHETSRPWIRLVCSALKYGGIEDETLCKLILFGLDYAEQCNIVTHLSDPAQPSVGGNHLLNNLLAWFSFALVFPEFRRTPALLRAAVTRLDDELSKQVTPDGAMIEGAPGYHNCCLYIMSEFLKMCGHYGLELPDSTLRNIERMLHFAVGLMKPNGHSPMFGDSQDDETAGYASRLAQVANFPATEWIAGRGTEGSPPAFTSKAFANIGYYVMRNGWEPDALYLCFDGGRFGQAHHHEDKLNFELFAYGRPFLVDPGVHSYSDHWFRGWSVLSQAHNTIDIDGVGQCRWRQNRDRWYSHVPLDNRWETGKEWDIVEATFDGPYECEIGAITQTRRVFFHRGEPGFWWITDLIDGPGTHEVTELFHFAHDLKIVPIAGGVRTRVPAGPELALLCLTEGIETRSYRGEEDPCGGWVSPRLNTVEPAWETHFTAAGALPMRRDFLLLPWRAEMPDDLRATFLPATSKLTLHIAGKACEFVLPQ